MARARTDQYAVIYRDGTYVVYELTKTDYNNLSKAKQCGNVVVVLSIGTLETFEIRAIILQKPAPKPKDGEDTGTPVLDDESLKWVEEYGKGGNV